MFFGGGDGPSNSDTKKKNGVTPLGVEKQDTDCGDNMPGESWF